MTADPWPLAVLLHTVSAPNKRQEPGWANPPALVWSPDQEEHLRAAWQGDAIRATDVPDLHAGPITHAPSAATLGVAQLREQNPQWVACMFRDAGGGAPPPGPQQGEALMLQAAGYLAILQGHAGGYRSHILAGGRPTSGTAPPGKGHSRPSPMGTGSRGPHRPTI